MRCLPLLLNSLALALLTQCSTVTTTTAPLIDKNGAVVVLSPRNKAHIKQSQLLASLENVEEAVVKQLPNKAAMLKHAPELAKLTDGDFAFKAGLVCMTNDIPVTTKSGEQLIVHLPMLVMRSAGLPQTTIDTMIPRIQKSYYNAASKQFRLIPYADVTPTKAPATGNAQN